MGEIEKSPVDERVSAEPDAHGNAAWRADPDRAAILLKQGQQHLIRLEWEQAIKCFENAINLDWPNCDPCRQSYFPMRAKAHELNGDDGPIKALEQYNAGIRYRAAGQYRSSISSYQQAIKLDPAFPWAPNNLSWLLATCPEPRFRDGHQAIRHATAACDIAQWHCWSFIDTLAAAWAEAGDFAKAIHYNAQAFDLAPEDDKPGLERCRVLFEAGMPVRRDV